MSGRKEEWPAIGIDLGTTYSCMAVLQHGGVEIITNDQNNRTTPSSVAFTDSVRLVGEAAVNQGRLNPSNTIFDVKRLIGRRFDDEMVQKDMRLWPFKVISGCEFVEEKKPMVVIRYKGKYKHFSAEEISAMILMKMKDGAEAYLDKSVVNVVITVPAYFNDSQRRATKDAGAIAGLNVLRLINEPIAAAIAYYFDNNMSDKDSSKRNVMVFDLGGGTFDVSLVSIENGTFTVKAVGGNTHLGGTDFDNNMVDYFIEVFKRKHDKDVSQSAKALARLRAACERAKRTLSLITETSVEVDCLFEGIDFTSSISRARFDNLNMYLFLECIQIVEGCLKDAGIGNNDVDDILLVGGSTRIPKVQELLQEFFNTKELRRSINPDEAVAYGAAVHAGTLCGVTNDKEMVLFEVTPLSLGVKMGSGKMSVVIPKNTIIPTRQVHTYALKQVEMHSHGVIDAHPAPLMKISLFDCQGQKAGVIELYVPPCTGSQSSVDVCFDIDINGILNVSAKDTLTGSKSEIQIINGSSLTTIDVKRLMKEAKEYKKQDKEYEEMVKAKNTLENYVNEQWEIINNSGESFVDKDKNAILVAVKETSNWLENSKKVSVSEAAMFQEKLEALEKVCKPRIPEIKTSLTSNLSWNWLRDRYLASIDKLAISWE